MFAESVIARRVDSYHRAHPNLPRLRILDIPYVRERVAYLEGRTDTKGVTTRPKMTAEFHRFIENERAMCKASFEYFSRRYCFIQLRTGMGGVELFTPFQSQMLLLNRLARDEAHMFERYDLGDMSFDGLLYFIHKSRQLGFTTLCQLLLLHRAIFYSDYKSLTASLDDQKTQDTHAKWWLAYTRLPWWMKTGIESREKERGKWLSNGSYCALQDFAQESGLGQGNTWDGFHLTEVAAVDTAYLEQHLENHFFGAVPRSMRAMGFLESTAQGRDNWWHKKFMRAWAHTLGRWGGVFIPWYAEPVTYSKPDIPSGWEPSDDTKAHAEKVRLTSPEYMEGRSVVLSAAQMYWWETEREAYKQDGALAYFLTNWCATIAESFQFTVAGAFNSERIIALQDRVDRQPVAYELIRNEFDRSRIQPRQITVERQIERGKPTNDLPRAYQIGDMQLVPVYTTERDATDPRGLVMMFDPPRADVVYSVGVDTAAGIVGWSRDFRRDDDSETRKDNSCASIWYHDRKRNIARQALEVAGPIAPDEFAPLVLALGRLYRGMNAEEIGAPLIIEVSPSESGARCQQILISQYGYYNFFQWVVFNGMEMLERNTWGWISSTSSVPLLWSKGKDQVESAAMPMRPQSQFLFEEMSGCRWDTQRRRGYAPPPAHDDRVTAALLSLWQLYNWANPIAHYKPQVVRVYGAGEEDPKRVDFQRRDLATEGAYAEAVDEWMDRIVSGG